MMHGFWDFVAPVLTSVATFATVYASIIRPRAKEKARREAAEAKLQLEREQDLDGIPARDGLTAGVPRLVVRVAAIEAAMERVTRGQALLEQRMNEANGTGKRTENMVRELMQAMAKSTE